MFKTFIKGFIFRRWPPGHYPILNRIVQVFAAATGDLVDKSQTILRSHSVTSSI